MKIENKIIIQFNKEGDLQFINFSTNFNINIVKPVKVISIYRDSYLNRTGFNS